jgi:hypothetical protein
MPRQVERSVGRFISIGKNMAMPPVAPEQPQDQMMAQESPEAGYTIEIAVDGQGAITVGLASDMADPTMPDREESGAQPAGSIKEALQMALDIFKASGQMNTTAMDEQAGFQKAMSQP